MDKQQDMIFIPVSPETVNRLVALRSRPDEGLSLVVERLASPSAKTQRVRPATSQKRNGTKWRIEALGRVLEADRLPDTLIFVIDVIAGNDAGALKRLERIQAQKRRLISQDRWALYPDKDREWAEPMTREFRPGWWIGTNIGQRDTERFLELICDEFGLSYGVRVKLKDLRPQKGGDT